MNFLAENDSKQQCKRRKEGDLLVEDTVPIGLSLTNDDWVLSAAKIYSNLPELFQAKPSTTTTTHPHTRNDHSPKLFCSFYRLHLRVTEETFQ